MSASTESQTHLPPTGGSHSGQLSDAVKASLAALEAARRAERKRRRRERLMVVLSASLTVTAIWGISSRVGSARTVAPVTRPAPVRAVVDAPAVAVASPIERPAAVAPPADLEAASASTALPEAPEGAAKSGNAEAIEACERASKRRSWREVTLACAAAFQVMPEGARALQVAQAHYRRGQVAEAGVWAERAETLDAALPEAAIIIAHASERAGDLERARRAYERYLTLAPQGWHASQARQGLARLR